MKPPQEIQESKDTLLLITIIVLFIALFSWSAGRHADNEKKYKQQRIAKYGIEHERLLNKTP